MRVQIFRVETETGAGAYNVGGVLFDVNSAHRHPSPEEDAKMAPGWRALSYSQKEHYFFGFTSEFQLLGWFYSEKMIRHAHGRGLGVTIYEVDEADVIIGHTQAVFIKSKAAKIDRLSILDFLD